MRELLDALARVIDGSDFDKVGYVIMKADRKDGSGPVTVVAIDSNQYQGTLTKR